MTYYTISESFKRDACRCYLKITDIGHVRLNDPDVAKVFNASTLPWNEPGIRVVPFACVSRLLQEITKLGPRVRLVLVNWTDHSD